jgi:hypothetical protein
MRTLGYALIGMMIAGTAHATPILTMVPERSEAVASHSEKATLVGHESTAKVQSSQSFGKLRLQTNVLVRNDGMPTQFSREIGTNRANSTNNGKKGNPALINTTMLLKMGGMHRQMEGEGSLGGKKEGKPSQIDTTKLIKMGAMHRSLDAGSALVGKKKGELSQLNIPKLIKMGSMAREVEGNVGPFGGGHKKGDPSQLNVSALIKMGGFDRLMATGASFEAEAKDRAMRVRRGEEPRRPTFTPASGRMEPKVREADRRAFHTRSQLDNSRVFSRDRVGNYRCQGHSCN